MRTIGLIVELHPAASCRSPSMCTAILRASPECTSGRRSWLRTSVQSPIGFIIRITSARILPEGCGTATRGSSRADWN